MTDQHQQLIQKLAYGPKALLREHFKKHQHNNDIYPLLLGGISHVRCVKSLFSMTTSDIDIKFVIQNKETPDLFKKALQMRSKFLNEIVSDNKIKQLLSQEFHNAYLTLGSVDTTMHGHRQVIYVQYHDEAKQTTLIDSAIVSERTFPFFKHYANFFFHHQTTIKPIPFILHNEIPFATCNWTYYDTIRMLNTSRIDFCKSPNNFFYKKYVKYIAKFISLYFVINKVKTINDSDLVKELYNVFKTVNETRINNFVPIETVLQKTNLNSLIKTYVAIPGIKLIEKQIINFILKKVLATHMKKWESANFYPLIIGGANLTRCFEKIDASRLSVIKDIDMPFIVTETKYMKKAESARYSMLKDLVVDPRLTAYLKRLGQKHQLDINIIWETYPDADGGFKAFTDRLKFNNIDIETKDLNGNVISRNSLIDSTVLQQSSSGKNEWHGYDKYIRKELKDPIPYIKSKGVNYATCGYTEFDLMKMLIIYKQEFEKAQVPNIVERLFKYMTKYALFCNQLDLAKKYKNFMKKLIFLDKNTTVCNHEEKKQVLLWYDELKHKTPFGNLEHKILALL